MTNWRDGIKESNHISWWNISSGVVRRAPPDTPVGETYFVRRKRRKYRRRYIILQTDEYGRKAITNTEIKYQRSKKVWTIFIDDEPVRSYRTLKAAKLALMPGVLDRMGAEVDATWPETSDSAKSLSDEPSSPQT